MASAVLANRSEPTWVQPQPQRGGANFMGKVPFSNPNPKFSKKRQFQQPALPPPPADADGSPGFTQSAASDDASSINRRSNDFMAGGRYVTFNVSNFSRKELVELKNQLADELEQIRQLKSRIETLDFQIRSNSSKKLQQPLSKKASGIKRPFPSTPTTPNFVGGVKNPSKRLSSPENLHLMKSCNQVLTKLMKHKLGYIFNSPVDVVGLQLHDYYDIIKCPMDLGTVKVKLGKNLYDSPRDFAADVRLVFNNAMKYNPKGHEVYALADQFLSRFEELYRPLKMKVGEEDDVEEDLVHEVQASNWDHNRGELLERVERPARMSKEEIVQVVAQPDTLVQPLPQSNGLNSIANQQPVEAVQLPVRTPSPMRAPPVKSLKQPKPKAKDPNKRDMSLEEKQKLGSGLQSLPPEKMDQVVHIIRKRNGHLRQEGDEIELDIEAVDNETLWELDRFVTNYKKMVSKIKRQALMTNNVVTNATANEVSKDDDVHEDERMDVVTTEAKKPKKGDVGDEDVDIGDDMPVTAFPPVEIEKDNGHASSSSSGGSSSSSDDSSSSSGSGSGSSSGSDSEDAQS